jgi:hypothetical protein
MVFLLAPTANIFFCRHVQLSSELCSMKFDAICCFIGLFELATVSASAQPGALTASYKKYPNRIELTWQATAAADAYIVQRRERTQKAFTAIDTVAQNRYVDRNNLRTNTDYIYCVRSFEPNGRVSTPSAEAVGALLSVADPQITRKDTLSLEDCLRFSITDAKITGSLAALRFLVRSGCPPPTDALITLYHSADAAPDDADLLLTRQSFDLRRTRGALTARHTGPLSPGYLLLKVEANGGVIYFSKKI